MNRLLEIDALRTVACFLVLIAHTAQEFSKLDSADPNAKVMHKFFWEPDLGRSAVTIFFAISGYFILNTLKGPRYEGSVDFWGRRLFRLYPVFWVSILAGILLIWLPKDLAVSGELILSNLTMIPKAFGEENIIGVFWTLETELMFYLLAWFLFLFRLHDSPLALSIIIMGLVILTFFFLINRDLAPSYHYWMAMPYHLSLMFWAALYRVYELKNDRPIVIMGVKLPIIILFASQTLFVLVLPLLAIMLFLVNDDIFALRNGASYIIGMFAFIIFTRWLPIRSMLLAKLGNYTFSIYLFHFAIILFLTHIIETYYPHLAALPIYLYILLVFALSLFFGHFLYNYVEKPFMQIAQRKFSQTYKHKNQELKRAAT